MPAYLIFSTENPNSIVDCIARARENARTMRHQIATEMWEALNRFHLELQRPAQRRRAAAGAENATTSTARSSSSASCSRGSPTRRCRARRAGTSCRPASSWSGRRRRRAPSTSTTGSWSATTRTTATASRWRPPADDLQPWAHAAALAVGLRGVPPHLEQRRPARRVIELLILSPSSRARSASRSGRSTPPSRHITRAGARPTTAPSRMPGASTESEAGARSAGCTRELAYQRLDDLVDHGLHAISARPPAPLLPHRRARRGRVLRPPAADGAGGDRREVPHPPPHDATPTRAPCYESFNEVRLQPLAGATQTCSTSTSLIEPPATVISFRDYYGNAVHDFGVPYLHDAPRDRGDERRRHPRGADEPLAGPARGRAGRVARRSGRSPANEALADELAEFLGPSTYVALDGRVGRARRRRSSPRTRRRRARLLPARRRRRPRTPHLPGRHDDRPHLRRRGARGRSGVCQDFAHVLISLCRHAGLPARYVSGYLGSVGEARRRTPGRRRSCRPTAGSASTRRSAALCTGRHVKVGVGRDYADVAVLRGTYQGGGQRRAGGGGEQRGARRESTPSRSSRGGGDEPIARDWSRSRTSARCGSSSAERC